MAKVFFTREITPESLVRVYEALSIDHFVERVERQNGRYILPYAEEIGLGSREYQLIEV